MNILILLFSVLSFAAAERKLDTQFLTYKATASGSSSPASGFETCYVKTDGFMYCKTSAGVEHRMQDSGQNSIKFTDAAGTYTYEIRGATPSGNILWDLPSNNGAAPDYFLKNNGAGLLSWASPSGSSGAGCYPGANCFIVRTDDAAVCSSNPCTIDQQYSSDGLNDAVTTFGRSSGGVYAITVKGGFCSTEPACTATSANVGFIREDSGATTTNIPLNTYNSGGSATDHAGINLMCVCDAP